MIGETRPGIDSTSPDIPAKNDPSEEIELLPLPYLELDVNGRIIRANRAAHAMHHPQNGSLIGSSGWDVIAGDERDDSFTSFRAALELGQDPLPVTRSIFDQSGTFRVYQLHRNLMRDGDGKPMGMRVVLVDVTEFTRSLEAYRREIHWLGSAVASMPDAVILTDALGAIRTVNAAAQKIAGSCSLQMVGLPIEEAFPLLEPHSADEETPEHNSALDRPWKGTVTIRNRLGREIRVEIRSAPIHDHQSGLTIGVATLLRDLSQEIQH